MLVINIKLIFWNFNNRSIKYIIFKLLSMNEVSLIDDLDRQILDIITKNARIPYLEVARECGVSGAAIHQRVQRLIRVGVIKGSEFIVDPALVGLKTCAFVGVFLDSPSRSKDAINKFKDIPEIIECHYTTGNYSLFIKVYARDNEHLRNILSDKIQSVEGVLRTETLISLEESINRQIPVL